MLGHESTLVADYYRPSVWVPHCTVAFNAPTDCMNAVIEACERLHAPFEARVTRLSAVRYKPASTVSERDLG